MKWYVAIVVFGAILLVCAIRLGDRRAADATSALPEWAGPAEVRPLEPGEEW